MRAHARAHVTPEQARQSPAWPFPRSPLPYPCLPPDARPLRPVRAPRQPLPANIPLAPF